MLTRAVLKLLPESQLKKLPCDHYQVKRTTQPLVIDYLFKLAGLLPEDSDDQAKYPPKSSAQLIDTFNRLDSDKNKLTLKQVFILYLTHDLKENNPDITLIPASYDFPRAIIHLATGLWAVDNDKPSLIVSCLSNPSIVYTNYFESPRELADIVVHALERLQQPRMALLMIRILQRNSNEDVENIEYDQQYASLMVNSGQLAEALKYIRIFSGCKNYREILQSFFELCSDSTKSLLNCLNLSITEEEVFNQHPEPKARNRMMHSQNGHSHHLSTSKNYSRHEDESRHEHKHQLQQRSHQKVRNISFTDSPARNTRSARKKKN